MFNGEIKGVRFLVDKVQFGNYIKKKRMVLGLTQEGLAEKLYISATAISKWENGKTYPDITIISQICNILKISEHEFVSACDDTELRKQAYEANKYRSIKRNTKWTLNILFALPVIICFICNLTVNHTLSWFFPTLFGIGIGYSIIALPFMVEKNKALITIATSSVMVIILIVVCSFFERFSLWRGVGVFLVFDALVWVIWAISHFTKKRMAYNFMAIGAYFYLFQFPISWLMNEKSNMSASHTDIYISIGLVLIGIALRFALPIKGRKI